MISIEYLVVLWAAFGTIAAMIADKKGRNTVAWWFIGAASGLFGIGVLLILPRIEKESNEEM